ncbi:MAG: Glu-tRNA(Gln) amidotransferase subunit GatE, partial [Candidatus Nanoarchaeia archaeon]
MTSINIIPTIKKELSQKDITDLKLTCGLEIHQQLQGEKLFCNCPTTIRDDKPDRIVQRLLRASAGESGTIDAAAQAEMNKKKTFLYEAYDDTTCLVELDEEPPQSPNIKAVMAAQQMAAFLNAALVDQIRFMRKTVVDGSNTSGFQRTALVGTNGSLLVDGQPIGVETVCIEEDSCKRVETKDNQQVYNLSRLGIPLIEIATAPDIHTPQLAQATAQSLGLLLRSLPNVKRGLGTIRQDVNVSIAKGVRVELKGAQDLKLIPTLVEYEMLRQHNMLEITSYLQKKGSTVGDIQDITFLLKTSDSKVLKNGLEKKEGIILALPLKGFFGVTGTLIQPNRRFGTELSDHAKLFGVQGLFHADELPHYGITQKEKDSIFKQLNLDPTKDNFILICAPHNQAYLAMNAV